LKQPGAKILIADCVGEWLSVTTHERRDDAQAFYRGIGMAQTGRRFGKALD